MKEWLIKSVGILAVLGWLVLLFSPLVVIYLPPGLPLSREAASSWSIGLAQIAFALLAAFIVFLLPHVIEVDHYASEWEERHLYYESSPSTNPQDAVEILILVLQQDLAFQQQLLPSKLRNAKTTIDFSKSPPSYSTKNIDKIIAFLSESLHDILLSTYRWKLLLNRSAAKVLEGHSPEDISTATQKLNDLRQLLLARTSAGHMKKRKRRLIFVLILMAWISFEIGILALHPDPFLYVYARYRVISQIPLATDFTYPANALWGIASLYILDTFFLALWFWLEVFHRVQVHNPERFDHIDFQIVASQQVQSAKTTTQKVAPPTHHHSKRQG